MIDTTVQTKVTIERFKISGSMKFYDSLTYYTETPVWDNVALKEEAREKVKLTGFYATLEVSREGAWNKYLLP